MLVQGDMWNIPYYEPICAIDSVLTSNPACEFPKGSGKNIMSAGSLWLAGYDGGHTLHVAAQTYRQDGNDYWPGPLDGIDTISYSNSQKWAKIWKVSYTDIQNFSSQNVHTLANIPDAILKWPAKGNPYATGNNNVHLTIVNDMAPFIDANNDGVYNPLDGDFPDIKGDQMLWWVYNDYCLPHYQSQTPALQVEVHAMAYAYHRNNLLDNVIFYQTEITNKSSITYDSFRIARFADEDIGTSWDDNIGYDSAHRMAIAYNQHDTDAIYGVNTPIVGVSFIRLPEDIDNNLQPVANMIYYINDFDITGNPRNGYQINNYMHGKALNDSMMTSPYMTQALAECNTFPPVMYDKRIVMTSSDMTFIPGETKTVVEALITVNPDSNNRCPSITTDAINEVADSAWNAYMHPPTQSYTIPVSANTNVGFYPNPAQTTIIFYNVGANDDIALYDIVGKTIIKTSGSNRSLNISLLPSGNYMIRITKPDGSSKTNLKMTKL